MKKKIFVVAIVCMVLFISVAAVQSPLRDLMDRIFGREEEIQITEIEDIIEDPEKYYNKTVTVEGIFGDVRIVSGENWAGGSRKGYGWMEGGMYGIYDEEGNSIAMWVGINRDELAKKAAEIDNATEETYSFDTYRALKNESWNRIASLDGKKIRATGYIDTYIMGACGYFEPVITVLDTDMEVVK